MAIPSSDDLRVLFFPFMTPGHMIPLLDIAKLFRLRGASVTLATTPGNDPLVRPTIDSANAADITASPIELVILQFPPSVTHLIPAGGENLSAISSSEFGDFVTATFALRAPLSDLILRSRFHCVVSDSIFAWTADLAREAGIPRIIFHGPGAFALCVHASIDRHAYHKSSSVSDEPFVVEDLPNRVVIKKSELSEMFNSNFMLNSLREGERKSYGAVVNSFYELEPEYAEQYKKGRRVWYVGPVSMVNSNATDTALRGGSGFGKAEGLLKWLDAQETGSVVYVCFGSLCEVGVEQLRETAKGLAASGRPFVWVVKAGGEETAGLEEAAGGGGVVVRGWAPQVAVLNHGAVGGFVTHCGWNSTLEGVAAGVAMATWPLSYDQFVNEKFITEVAGVGVRIKKGRDRRTVVRGKEVAEAVGRLMGEEGTGIRMRAREMGEKARAAMRKDGSSTADMDRLVEELRAGRMIGDEIEPVVV